MPGRFSHPADAGLSLQEGPRAIGCRPFGDMCVRLGRAEVHIQGNLAEQALEFVSNRTVQQRVSRFGRDSHAQRLHSNQVIGGEGVGGVLSIASTAKLLKKPARIGRTCCTSLCKVVTNS